MAISVGLIGGEVLECKSEITDIMFKGLINDINDLGEENLKLKRELSKYKAKEILNRKQFDYILCTKKNGNKFIKVIYDSYEADGWVEVARINLSKSEWVEDRFSIEDVLDELQ